MRLPVAWLTLVAGVVVAPAPPAHAADGGAPDTTPPAVQRCAGWKVAEVAVRGSMAAALAPALGDEGSQVAAHYARIFMWDLDLRRDIVAGDRIRVVWRSTAAGEPEIGAAQYASQRLGRVLRAYRSRGPDDSSPSYWDGDGLEVARRLKNSPLRDYEQITALLKDRPTHQGMDFKTPVGTAVYAPRGGVVSRINWKRSGNGNCLELQYDDGVLAKFLHLSAVKVSGRARVSAGQVIALTGNTGHSTAPHLHYQLNRGTKTLDPVDYHGTTRRKLSGPALAKLKADIVAFERACGAGNLTLPRTP
jgi:murein DD-endopeptidase MepM/ murein hydrolase activator NlpD